MERRETLQKYVIQIARKDGLKRGFLTCFNTFSKGLIFKKKSHWGEVLVGKLGPSGILPKALPLPEFWGLPKRPGMWTSDEKRGPLKHKDRNLWDRFIQMSLVNGLHILFLHVSASDGVKWDCSKQAYLCASSDHFHNTCCLLPRLSPRNIAICHMYGTPLGKDDGCHLLGVSVADVCPLRGFWGTSWQMWLNWTQLVVF